VPAGRDCTVSAFLQVQVDVAPSAELSLKRMGAACASVVIVPSGFAQVVDVSDRIDSTSTLDPCARADTAADTTSGRELTFCC
jgi:hypothetical protein